MLLLLSTVRYTKHCSIIKIELDHLLFVRHRLSSGKNQSQVARSLSDKFEVHMSMERTPTCIVTNHRNCARQHTTHSKVRYLGSIRGTAHPHHCPRVHQRSQKRKRMRGRGVWGGGASSHWPYPSSPRSLLRTAASILAQ